MSQPRVLEPGLHSQEGQTPGKACFAPVGLLHAPGAVRGWSRLSLDGTAAKLLMRASAFSRARNSAKFHIRAPPLPDSKTRRQSLEAFDLSQ